MSLGEMSSYPIRMLSAFGYVTKTSNLRQEDGAMLIGGDINDAMSPPEASVVSTDM